MNNALLFHQLFEHESATYTYILADRSMREAIIIDSVLETAQRDIKLIEELGYQIKYILDTHVHADHITAASILRKQTGAKTVVGAGSKVECADILISDGEKIKFGPHEVTALATPGHTDSCTSYLVEGMVFTGDALLVRGCGRTDFQQGDSAKLFDSVTQKLFTLPEETIVYPAHDYKGFTSSSVGMEKKWNPRLGGEKSKAEFVQIMSELKLAQPKKIMVALPANLKCGSTVAVASQG